MVHGAKLHLYNCLCSIGINNLLEVQNIGCQITKNNDNYTAC